MKSILKVIAVLGLLVILTEPAHAGGRRTKFNSIQDFTNAILAVTGRPTGTSVGAEEQHLHNYAFLKHHEVGIHPLIETRVIINYKNNSGNDPGGVIIFKKGKVPGF